MANVKYKIFVTIYAKNLYDDNIEGEYDGVEYETREEAQNRIDEDLLYSREDIFGDRDFHLTIEEVIS